MTHTWQPFHGHGYSYLWVHWWVLSWYLQLSSPHTQSSLALYPQSHSVFLSHPVVTFVQSTSSVSLANHHHPPFSLKHFWECMYVWCTCLYVYVHVKVSVAGCGGQKLISALSFSHTLPFCFWERVLRWTYSVPLQLVWLVSKMQGYTCLLWGYRHMPLSSAFGECWVCKPRSLCLWQMHHQPNLP